MTTPILLRATIEKLSSVGTLPAVAMRIMRVADDPSATEDQLHDALLTDPPLAARVLRVVNSAFYRRQREVSSPRAAIRMLGSAAVRNIALASSLHRLFRPRRGATTFDPADVWTHSLVVAIVARDLATRSGAALPEEALLAGLLHDIGIIVEMQVWPDAFAKVVQEASLDASANFLDLEHAATGATHAEFGAALCDAWQFPDAFARVCRHHHDHRVLPHDDQALTAIVQLADHVAARMGEGYTRTVDLSASPAEALLRVGLEAEALTEAASLATESLPVVSALLAA